MLGVCGEPSSAHMELSDRLVGSTACRYGHKRSAYSFGQLLVLSSGQLRFRVLPDHQRRGSVVPLSAITP